MTPEELKGLVGHLRSLPRETEWLELKHKKAHPQQIGEYISALANSAALHRRPQAFLLWGVEDGSHNLVGTSFRPRQTKKGNEELENWILRLLSPRIDFRIHEGEVDGKHVVMLEIPPAERKSKMTWMEENHSPSQNRGPRPLQMLADAIFNRPWEY